MTRKDQILELISEGMTTDEIAEKLKISPNSVKTYRKELLASYKAYNSAHLVRLWMEELKNDTRLTVNVPEKRTLAYCLKCNIQVPIRAGSQAICGKCNSVMFIHQV